MSDVLYDVEDGVAIITWNRPDRLNAWTDDLQESYFSALHDAVSDGDVRAIVVTGAGSGFCAGADLEILETVRQSGGAIERPPSTYPFQVPKLIVGAINGACAGMGLVQALYMDVRFASTTAKLTTSFAKIGLVAEYGIDWLLARLVGPGVAIDLLASSRIILGEEAERMGLVNATYQPEDLLPAAMAYAQSVAASCSPSSIAIMKWQMRRSGDLSFEEAETVGRQLMGISFKGPDFWEGLSAISDKREPHFPSLGMGTNFKEVTK